MDYSFLKQALKIAKIVYKENEPLAPKTTFKIGNTADLFIIPDTIEQFRSTMCAVKAQQADYFILGGGSNVVFPDNPYTGIIISTQALNNVSYTDDDIEGLAPNEILVTCQSGTPMATFVNFCTRHCLKGVEQFAGLPGSVGGAVYMNARCFEKSISDVLYQTEHFECTGKGQSKLFLKPFDNSEWDYKKSPFQTNDKFITAATFRLTKIPKEEQGQLEADCKKYIAERVDKGHFKYPSAGSVFKNNHAFGKPSGKIIDEAGLKGKLIGGAQIAPFHGNFIINVNNATANDVKELVKLTQKTVKDLYNFDLETEIIFI